MSFSINVKTISQLPEAVVNDVSNVIQFGNNNLQSLLEVSVPSADNNKYCYTSKKLPFYTLLSSLENNIKNIISNDNIISANEYINGLANELSNLYINKIHKEETSAANSIIFKNNPYISTINDNNKILKKSEVKDLVTSRYQQMMFNQDTTYTEYKYNKFKAQYINDASETQKCTINETGNLVVTGWISDNGNIALGNAWVQLQIKKRDGTWLAVQMQPWILGERHKQVQLVSFNLPIAAGTTIRVVTGFTLNNTNSGFQLVNNALASNEPNQFTAVVFH